MRDGTINRKPLLVLLVLGPMIAGCSGAPDSVNFSNTPRGDRVAIVTYSRGQRAGIYTFTAGRLSSIERGPEPVQQPKGAKPKRKPAAT